MKQRSRPQSGQLSQSEEKYLRLRMNRMICGGLNGMKIRQSLPQAYPGQVPWKAQWVGAGVYGLWSNPGVRAAVDCGETDGGDVREEIMVETPVEESQAAMEAR